MTEREKARVVTKLIADQLKTKSNFAMRDVEDCVVTLLRERTDASSQDLINSVWNEALEMAARKADKVIQVGLAAEIRALKR